MHLTSRMCQLFSLLVFLVSIDSIQAVDQPPTFTVQPISVAAIAGERIELNCQATGVPSPTYEWLKGTQKTQLTYTDRVYTTPSGSLLFKSFDQKSDIDIYFCEATNKAGRIVSPPAFVDAAEKPIVTLQPVNRTVLENDNVSFPCGGSGTPSPDYTWKTSQNAVVHRGTPLELSRVGRGEAGKYTCEMANKAGITVASAWLRVEYPAHAEVKPGSGLLPRHTSAQLTCTFGGLPRPTVRWLKDNNKISRDNWKVDTLYHDNDGTSVLTLDRLHQKDTGSYACVALNSRGEARSTSDLTVQVPPEVPIDLKIVTISAREVTLSWKPGHSGHSQVENFTVEASDGGKTVVTKVVGSDAREATLTGLEPGTAYELSVHASNGIGAGSKVVLAATTKLSVPDAPSVTEAVSQKSSPYAIQLTWSIGSDGGSLLTEFHIGYRQSGSDGLWNEETVNGGGVRSMVLSGLKPEQSYTFRICAENEVGKSAYSVDREAETRSLGQPGEVQNIRVMTLEGKVKVSWTVADQTVHENTLVDTYVVTLKPKDGEEQRVKDITKPFDIDGQGRMSCLVENITPEKEYQVTVQAESVHGQSRSSMTVLVSHEPSDPSASPVDSTDSVSLDGLSSLSNDHFIFVGAGCGAAVVIIILVVAIAVWRRRRRREVSITQVKSASSSNNSSKEDIEANVSSSLISKPNPSSVLTTDHMASLRTAFENAASPTSQSPPSASPLPTQTLEDMFRSIGTDLPGEECFMSRIGSRVCSDADLEASVSKLPLKDGVDDSSLSIDGASDSTDIAKEKCVKFVDSPTKHKGMGSPLWRPSNHSYTQRGLVVKPTKPTKPEPDSYV